MSEQNIGEVFKNLNSFDVTPYIKQKLNQKYLPWSSVWTILMEKYPGFQYTPIKSESGLYYHTDGKTCWVETSLTIQGTTINETLAIMDQRNASIPLENIKSTEVTKNMQRCFVKNAARFGLGLSLWIGEDYSEAGREQKEKVITEKETRLNALHAEILNVCTIKKEEGVEADVLYEIIERVGGQKKNPNSVKDIAKCEMILEEINKLGENNG